MGTYSKLLNIEKEAESKTDTVSPNPNQEEKTYQSRKLNSGQ